MTTAFIVCVVFWCVAIALLLLAGRLIWMSRIIRQAPPTTLPPKHFNCRCTINERMKSK